MLLICTCTIRAHWFISFKYCKLSKEYQKWDTVAQVYFLLSTPLVAEHILKDLLSTALEFLKMMDIVEANLKSNKSSIGYLF